MRFLIAIVLCLTVGFAFQGNKPQIKKKQVGNVNQSALVTKAEAAAVFARARKAIISARISGVPNKPTIVPGNAVATREEVILEMAKIVDASRKSMKFVPKPVKYDVKMFKVGSASSRSALARLVEDGFVAPVGPLATGPKPGLTVAQFGDAVGFFLARITDVTHMPSPKWSPYLSGG